MDIRNFLLVMQWKVHALNAVSLAQRLGRAARDAALKAIFIIFAEGKYIEDKGAEGQKKGVRTTQSYQVSPPGKLAEQNPGAVLIRTRKTDQRAHPVMQIRHSQRPASLQPLSKT